MKISDLKVGDRVKLKMFGYEFEDEIKLISLPYFKFGLGRECHQDNIICKLEEVKNYKEILIDKEESAPKSFKFDFYVTDSNWETVIFDSRKIRNTIDGYSLCGGVKYIIKGLPAPPLFKFNNEIHYTIEIREKK